MMGPYVIQAIIDKTGNNWQGFPFLFAICTASALVIWFGVDVQKGIFPYSFASQVPLDYVAELPTLIHSLLTI